MTNKAPTRLDIKFDWENERRSYVLRPDMGGSLYFESSDGRWLYLGEGGWRNMSPDAKNPAGRSIAALQEHIKRLERDNADLERAKAAIEQDHARLALASMETPSRCPVEPTAEDKYALIGEFSFFVIEYDDGGQEMAREVLVPWSVIKQIRHAVLMRLYGLPWRGNK